MWGFSPYSPSRRIPAWPSCGVGPFEGTDISTDFAGWMSPKESQENWSKNERPVRGDNRTGQAIWALGVDGRSRRIRPRWGGITAPTSIGRGGGATRSNGAAIFLTLWQEFLDGKLLRGGTIAIAHDRLVGGHGGRRLVQCPRRGHLLPVRSLFGGGRFRNRDDRHR